MKPSKSLDGKVACTQCDQRIDKSRFKAHATTVHMSSRPFNCNLCPHNEKDKGSLTKHQKSEHGIELSQESFTYTGSEAKIKEIVEQCFGETKEVDWARKRCQPCDKLINKSRLWDHVAYNHLKKTLYACKLCEYKSSYMSAGQVNQHVKKTHKKNPGPDTIDSSQAKQYSPIIKAMISQVFTDA